MEQVIRQSTSCPDCGPNKEILGVKEPKLVNRDPRAYSVLAKLSCGHSVRIIMSENNLNLIQEYSKNINNES